MCEEWESFLQLLSRGIDWELRANYSPSVLRKTHDSQFIFGQVPIADIQLDLSNQDDIPVVLMGYRH